ncbi:hypothetical protein TSUD_27470 [Trifolium subterraneum]|uniref:Reverse transcriptase Ty1/copia-type domain-containing protein n=1 Tax=Trifolium subterraneum TaxID=3900 RepID=A0A2Z6NJU5_TRISU|nr:hypothetical protein TSUD_27470 [Trifolium subterraneum]
MQYAKIPKTLCDEMEKIQRGFLWGDTDQTRKPHLISWEVCCLPKDDGGLGMRSPHQMNEAFLMKMLWNMINNPNDLWCKVLYRDWDINFLTTHLPQTTVNQVLAIPAPKVHTKSKLSCGLLPMSVSLQIIVEVNGALVYLPFVLFAEMKMKQSFMDWIFDNLNEGAGGKNQEWQTIFMVICWQLWMWRNKTIFEDAFNLPINPTQVIVKMSQEIDSCMKTNLTVNLSGCGGLLRDSSGICLVSYARKLETCDALHAEMRGMYLGMNLALRQGITHLQVDSDSKVLVDMVTGNCTINGSIPTLVRRIRDLKTDILEVPNLSRNELELNAALFNDDDLPSLSPPIPDPPPISPVGPHNPSPASSTTIISSSPSTDTPNTSPSPTPLAQPAPPTRTIATRSMQGDDRSQVAGVNCVETFSPVVKPSTIHTVLTIALSKSWPIHQLDVHNAFLHGDVHETVYMHQPLGFRDPHHPNYVCRLRNHSTDLGPLSYFLGITVTKHADGLFLSQSTYASEIIARAGMASCKPSATPVDTKQKLNTFAGTPYDDPTLYRSLAGALQYLTFTRPDISYAVQQVCLHMHAPCTDHMLALKRIMRYIQGTLHYGLHHYPSPIEKLVSYTDADWEAEYMGVANVVSESCWLRNLLLELHFPLSQATLVYCDNVSTIYLTGNPVQHQRTKHIEMDIHFVREKVARGQACVLHVPSRHQIADIFTKGLPRILFYDFRTNLSIREPPASTAGV